MIVIGIDNGVSGSIAILRGKECIHFGSMPTFSAQDYVKKSRNITRIEYSTLFRLLRDKVGDDINTTVVIERPMVNPGRFRATISAVRALEATLIAVERLGYRLIYADSRSWQKNLLPSGAEGADLKKASADIGKRLFPKLAKQIDKHKDADGLLIAEWARRQEF